MGLQMSYDAALIAILLAIAAIAMLRERAADRDAAEFERTRRGYGR